MFCLKFGVCGFHGDCGFSFVRSRVGQNNAHAVDHNGDAGGRRASVQRVLEHLHHKNVRRGPLGVRASVRRVVRLGRVQVVTLQGHIEQQTSARLSLGSILAHRHAVSMGLLSELQRSARSFDARSN